MRDMQALRAQLEHVQGRSMAVPYLPVVPALAELLPGRGLRPGAVYSVRASAAIVMALMAKPSQSGLWCAAVGMPRLGVEAAQASGVELSRMVLIPDPGARWMAVTATVADVLSVVAVRPGGRVVDAEASRLSARLRDRGAVLIVQGEWAHAEAMIEVTGSSWSGLASGHGYLDHRELDVRVISRRGQRSGRVMLPAAGGGIAASHASEVSGRIDRARAPLWKAVG